MLIRPSNGVMTRAVLGGVLILVLLAALAVSLLLPGGLLQAQQTAETFYFHENGDGPVVTLTANDPEGVTPIYWDILDSALGNQDLPGGNVGANADDVIPDDIEHRAFFEVEGGVLTFKEDMLPDFEARDPITDQEYKVVVQASDGGVTEWVQYFKVTVIVTDLEETGKVTWTVDPDGDDNTAEAADQDLLEFQAGARLSATVTDPDGPTPIAVATTTWRWYRSASMSATGTMITDENGAPIATNIYDVSDASDNNDVGMYLRAVATYTDRRGANKTAQFVSPYRVRPAKVGSNTVPKFAPTNFDRQVQEGPKGMTVGGVVTATDADGDVLNYTLDGTNAASFEIDQATGQITTAVALNYDGDPAPPRSFTVTVKATDSAGGETVTGGSGDLADATVTITLLDVNEAPVFEAEVRTLGSEANIEGMAADRPEEGVGAGNMWTAPYTVAAYTVDDPEGIDIGRGKWSLSGDDEAIFKLTGTTPNTRTLEFREKADFEMPGDFDNDNIYEVTVVASDGEEAAMRSVTVKITDRDEAGKITLSTENPVTGTPVKATLTDSDGDVINIDWKWYALTDAQVADAADIAAAIALTGVDSTEVKADDDKPDSYTPTSGDITKHLLAVATYMDRTEDEDNDSTNNTPAPGYMGIRFNNMAMSDPTAPVIDDPANAAPMFVEGDRAVRYVEEDDEENRPNRSPAETIGAPLMVTDDDDDSLTFTLGGADAASFNIDAASGQLMTKAMLDYDGTKKRYTVVVTVKDGSGAPNDTDRITVTIEVKGKDEKPGITGKSNFDNHNENTSLVGPLMATDPERVTPIYWEILETIGSPAPMVDGTDLIPADTADRANFDISLAGVLRFKEDMLPDFESPASTNETRNTYKVVVKASDGGMETWVQYFRVTVIVTDLEETGKVTWTVDPDGDDNTAEAADQDLLEFQAGARLSATVTDPDGPTPIAVATTTWRWYRSASMSATGTMITDENGAPIATNIYDVSDTADNNDVGMYLRAVATYTDRRGANKTAQFVSPYRVRPAKVEDNALPKFAPTAHTRRVQEGPKGMTVGGVVTATDADGDVLNYTLDGTNAASFEIDQATGQITTAVALNYDGDPAPPRSFTVTVKATDSAGGETVTGGSGDLADATVTITLLDVNEAPVFEAEVRTLGSEANIEGMAADRPEEGVGAGNMWTAPYTVAAYTVDDPEGIDIGRGKWSLSGDDEAIFKLTGTTPNTRTLEFREKADFEMPGDFDNDNIYEVTVVASDGEEAAMRSVTVKITDRDEAGKITLSTENPVTGTPVKATLTDSDGDVINIDWKWYALTDAQVADAADIAAAIALTGVDSTEVKADDDKPDSYTPTSGDITKHLLAVATYMDRTEDEDNDSTNNTPAPGYMGIRFNNMAMSDPTAPVIDDPANAAPMFVEGDRAVRYVEEDDEENRPNRSPAETIGAPLMVTDDDGVTTTSHTFTLGGADAASFNIDAASGQLMTKAMLEYEGTKKRYTVVVTVDDGSKASNATDSITVTIEVKDLDEKPVISGEAAGAPAPANNAPVFPATEDGARSVAENTAAGEAIGAPVAATDADTGDTLAYTLGGADMAPFDIDSASGQLMTKAALDHETKASYTVTVTASDGNTADDATIPVTITVANVDDPGTVKLSSTTAPRVGTELTASVDDPDGGVTGDTWQWASSSDGLTGWANISEATSAAYTPVDADVGKYLRATPVSYTDNEGSGKSAPPVVSASAVVATSAPTTGSAVGDIYDTNHNGVIDSNEVLDAVEDYFDDELTPDQILDIVELYFSS